MTPAITSTSQRSARSVSSIRARICRRCPVRRRWCGSASTRTAPPASSTVGAAWAAAAVRFSARARRVQASPRRSDPHRGAAGLDPVSARASGLLSATAEVTRRLVALVLRRLTVGTVTPVELDSHRSPPALCAQAWIPGHPVEYQPGWPRYGFGSSRCSTAQVAPEISGVCRVAQKRLQKSNKTGPF